MKTLATVMSLAALLAGISIASAQDTSPGMKRTQQPDEMGRVEGANRYCIQISKSTGGVECKYATLTACESDARPNGLQCSPNPDVSTTGSK